MDRQTRTQARLAALYGALGVVVLAALATHPAFPFPDPLTWLVFTVVFVALEWRAVEVNDRMVMSSTVMVALTAGVVFAVGEGSAALGMAAMAALGPLVPEDLRQRRWFQPAVNFGQMVATAAVSGIILDYLLGSVASPPGNRALIRISVVTAAVAVVHATLNFGQVRSIVRVAYARRDIRPWSGFGTLVPSYLVMGFVGGLLGATLLVLDWVVLPLVLVVFVAGHLAFASYAELREAHEATLRGFIKALEAKDLYTRGHTERVAYFAQLIGEQLKFRGSRLQRLRWAALIHDVGKLAVPRDLIRKKGRLSEAEYQELQTHAHIVEDLLAEVEFLRPMVQIASGHHSHFDGSGYGGTGHTHGNRPSREACILAVADAFDAMTSTRSYRMALSQEFAFSELRRKAGTQFDPEAVEALIAAMRRTGERYGSPTLNSEGEARRLAEHGVPQRG